MRRITTYSTLGGNEKTFMTGARTLGELLPELSSNGVSHSGMKLVVGETQVTLESSEAVLPEDNFTLFLTAQKVKSGYDEVEYDDEYKDEVDADDIDWDDDYISIGEFNFTSDKELALARIKLAEVQLRKAAEYFGASSDVGGKSDLAAKAREIQKNIDLFR
jgi:hypothetical protein